MRSHPARDARREGPGWPRRLLTALVLCLLLGAMSAGPASAHATLLFADPAVGGAVPGSPVVITLVFDEAVTLSGSPVQLIGDRGRPVSLGPARSEQGGRVVAVQVAEALARGVFEVRWQVVADDGDPVGGTYQFIVGPAASITPAAVDGGLQRQSPALGTSAVLRWLLFLALSVGLGGSVGARVVRRHAGHQRTPSPWTGSAAVAGGVAAAGLAALIGGNGSLWGWIGDPALGPVARALPGQLALVEVVAFAASGALSRTRARDWAWLPLLAVVVSEGLRSHVATALPSWGALLTALHLLAAAIWVGALGQTVRAVIAGRGSPGRSWAALAAYARLAGWVFGAVVVTGACSALLLVPWSDWTTTPYGRVLLLKLALVALAATLAVLGRRAVRRASTSGERVSQITKTARTVRVELAAVVAVLGVTAVLVSLPTPDALAADDLALPPPPSGVVVPLGARAGMIGISAAASSGQLVVHLSAPRLGNRAGAVDPTVYRLAGAVSLDGQRELRLTWRGCGPGCFVTPVHWTAGQNPVTLRAGADDWPGGQVSVVVPWPARPGDEQLRGLVATMARVPRVTVHERITSDSRTGLGLGRPLTMSGKEFLGVEPYGSGRATQVALLGRSGGQTTLAVGFPGDLTQAELVIDDDGRLLRETLTAPYHWISRSFVYPER